jgi:hypothetical protein
MNTLRLNSIGSSHHHTLRPFQADKDMDLLHHNHALLGKVCILVILQLSKFPEDTFRIEAKLYLGIDNLEDKSNIPFARVDYNSPDYMV